MKGHELKCLHLEPWQRAAKAYRISPCADALTALKIAALEWAAEEELRERARMINRVHMRAKRAA